ncbi:MAG: PKD domain-containing protein [Planctomycetota bacterium]
MWRQWRRAARYAAGWGGLCVIVLVGAALSPRPSFAFGPEQLVSSGTVAAAEPALLVDAADNVLVAFVEAGELRFATGPAFQPGGFLVVTGAASSTPSLHNSVGGVSTVVFGQNGEILRLNNLGGPFGGAVPLTQDALLDRDPVLAGTAAATGLHLVWVREDSSGNAQLCHSVDFVAPAVVATGDAPDLFVDDAGAAHLVYSRAGSIYYRTTVGGVFGAEEVVTAATTDSAPVVGVTPDNTIHIGFLRNDAVYIARRAAGSSFTPPQVITAGLAAGVRIAVNGNWIELYYEQVGELWRVTGTGSFLTSPVNMTQTPTLTESMHELTVDSSGYAHVVYSRGNQLYYRNDVPAPLTAFSVDVASGEAPHAVSFSNESLGPIQSWLWDFGDGTTSAERAPSHVYAQVGSYDVSLTATGVGGSHTTVVPAAVTVLEPTNLLWIPDLLVTRGDPEACFPVLATHTGELQGFQLAVTWDCVAMNFMMMDLNDTAIGLLAPEFIGTQLSQDPGDCYFTAGLIIDAIPPFDLRTVPPGTATPLANLLFEVLPAAPNTTFVDLQSGVGSPPIDNIFIVESVNIDPLLFDSVVTVVDPALAPTPFIRGDANLNGVVNLQDIVIVLSYLFNSGTSVACFDAADGNDSGSVDIADPVFIMTFLFGNGDILPYPFPCSGFDPTPDGIPHC